MGYFERYLSLDTRAHCTPETVHLRYAKMITSNHFGISYACHIAYDFFVSIEASPCMCKCMETTWKQMFESTSDNHLTIHNSIPSQIAKFMGPTWGPPGSCRTQIGPVLAPWTLLSGMYRYRHVATRTDSHAYKLGDTVWVIYQSLATIAVGARQELRTHFPSNL